MCPSDESELAAECARLRMALAKEKRRNRSERRKWTLEKRGLQQVLKEKDDQNTSLKASLRRLQRLLFGPRSERFEGTDRRDQLRLDFGDLEDPPAKPPKYLGEAPDDEGDDEAEDEATSASGGERKKKRKARAKGTGPRPFPENATRWTIPLPTPDEHKICECCQSPRQVVGQRVEEIIERVPSKWLVLEYVSDELQCAHCAEPKQTVESPVPIPGTRAGPRLLTEIVVRKYHDHMPLERLSAAFGREGFEIPKSTLSSYVREVARLLTPVVAGIEAEVKGYGVVGVDDTSVEVRSRSRDPTRPEEKASSTGYLFAFGGERGSLVYKAANSRKGETAAAFFEGYQGYVQADGANTFDQLFRSGERVEVGCWAHARRNFYELRETCEESRRVLAVMRKLYDIEKEARDLTPEARWALRQEKSKLIVEDLLRVVEHSYKSEGRSPKDPLQKAWGYVVNQKEALGRYLEDGRLEMDNNRIERAMRAVVLGRKNWLFAGSWRGAESAATLYSVVGSCKELGVSAEEYLLETLKVIGTLPVSEAKTRTPREWARAKGLLTE